VSYADGVKLAQELVEKRADAEDPRWHIVHDVLYRGALERSKLRFIERYLNNVLILHLHGNLLYIDRMHRLIEFCAVCEHGSDYGTANSPFAVNDMLSGDCRNGRVQMSMLVDIRKYAQHPNEPMPIIPSVIWLQSLNDCKCFIRNAARDDLLAEVRSGNGRDLCGVSRRIKTQGEFDYSGDIFGDGATPVPLDKIEKDVIKCRPEMVDDFASNHRYLDGRGLCDLQCRIAIRMDDFSIRLAASVSGNAVFESLVLTHCSNDFCMSRI
jgi:hypothetical protein